MAVKPSDTNPNLTNTKIREILKLENEIDSFLLKNLRNGRASYLVNTTKDVVEIIAKRFQQSGWNVKIGYSGENLSRLDFEDTDQLEITKKYKTINNEVKKKL